MRLCRVLVPLALVLSVPASADAASVRISGSTLRFAASGGESNHLSVTREPSLVVLTDPGARMRATSPCRVQARTRAVCPDGPVTSLSISLGDGNDQVDVSQSVLTASINGGSGDDLIAGGPGGDRLAGGPGSDTVTYAMRTNGVVVDLDGNPDDGEPGEGDNVLNDVETVVGGSGDDTISAVSGSKHLIGGPGDDSLFGGSSDDLLQGGPGNDRLDGRVGNDTLDGGDGVDLADYLDSFDAVHANLASGFAILIRGSGPRARRERDTLVGDEWLRGSVHDDRLRGDAGPNVLSGGRGNDVLDGDLGPDALIGGGGRDRADYSHRRGGVTVTLDGVADDGAVGEGDDVDPSVEDVTGGAGSDVLVGSDRANVLAGGAGRDRLIGGGGNDLLTGGERGDFLDGGTGADRLVPGPGADQVFGGPGGDALALRDGDVDRADCGPGRDTVSADRFDRLSNCEAVR